MDTHCFVEAVMSEGLKAADVSSLTAAEVLTRLISDREHGLSEEDVKERREVVGWNEFQISQQEPLWRKYLEQFKNPLIVLLLISALISIVMQQFDDAFSITLAIVIVVTVAFVQEYRSERSLEALTQLVPHKCHCVRGGVIQEALARELVPGDIVCVGLGDRIPADMRIIEATDLHVDESSFTGETTPAEKTSKAVSAPPKGSTHQLANICYMGTYVVAGHGKAVVVCTGEGSEFGNVFRMMQEMESPKTPLQKNMDTLGKQLSFYSMCIIGLIMLIGWIQGKPLLSMFTIGVSLAVAAIPEGLPIVVTVTLALGVMRLASRHAIVKKLPVVETLGCVTVVCSDKTGTLTENELTATELYSAKGHYAIVQGNTVMCGNVPVSASSHPDIASVIEVGSLCNSAQMKLRGAILGHPVDAALLGLAGKTGLLGLREQYTKEEERPFNSEQKWMAVRLHKVQGEPVSCWMMKGALDRVMLHCLPLGPEEQEALLSAAKSMGTKGLRVIAMARGSALGQLSLEGLVGMVDPPREGVAEAIQYLHRTGVQVKVITGDARETAINIAETLGVWDGYCMSGEELEQQSAEDNTTSIAKACVFYRVSPKHKITIVQALQRHGNVVAMTGDGTNDAVALKGSEIGIAMGKSGTDVCREAGDMILTDDNFLTIVAAIKEGKGIFYNIKNFVRFQLSTSIAALSLIAVSTVLGLPNPLNAMQILWINIIMDGPPAQSLGVEPVDHHIIMQPPRKTTDAVITKSLILQTSLSALLILLGTLWVFWTEMAYDGQVTPRDTTMTFTCFVLFDMFNAFSCRSQMESSISLGFFRNKPFLYAVTGSLIGQLLVVYFPPLQAIFITEALTLRDIVGLVCLASTVLWVDELRKFIMSGKLNRAMDRVKQKQYEVQVHQKLPV